MITTVEMLLIVVITNLIYVSTVKKGYFKSYFSILHHSIFQASQVICNFFLVVFAERSLMYFFKLFVQVVGDLQVKQASVCYVVLFMGHASMSLLMISEFLEITAKDFI